MTPCTVHTYVLIMQHDPTDSGLARHALPNTCASLESERAVLLQNISPPAIIQGGWRRTSCACLQPGPPPFPGLIY